MDQAAFFSRHGSRYPDVGAYNEWSNLSSRIAAANFTTNSPHLDFLSTWTPVLKYPDQQIAQLSTTGYKELYDMGATYRHRYDDLYTYNSPFVMWSNYYKSSPRVRDSARLFSHGFLGPNATDLGSIYALNSSAPESFMNSLAPSDLCPAYVDNGGSPQIDTWADTYLPPIQRRLNSLINGSFQFTQSDISIIPYLCGFETQITGHRSPWCDVFTESETLQYEYAQDIRYWYGNGPGSQVGADMMLPFLSDLVLRFIDGPNATYQTSKNATFKPNRLIAAFTNDGQVNQLVSGSGIFDSEPALPSTFIPANRTYKASNFVTMRSTISFERLNCGSAGLFMRLKLNDQVYPVARCQNGPGRSCALADYQRLVEGKIAAIGSFAELCGVSNVSAGSGGGRTSFLQDRDLPFVYSVAP